MRPAKALGLVAMAGGEEGPQAAQGGRPVGVGNIGRTLCSQHISFSIETALDSFRAAKRGDLGLTRLNEGDNVRRRSYCSPKNSLAVAPQHGDVALSKPKQNCWDGGFRHSTSQISVPDLGGGDHFGSGGTGPVSSSQ